MTEGVHQPLTGVRVVELARDLPAAWCARQLADWGADVTVAEAPEGSPLRTRAPYAPGTDTSLLWEYVAAGKGSAVAGTPQDLVRLLADAVIVTDHPPDELDTPAGTIVVSVTPFGLSGPYSELAGTDLVVQALSGYLSLNGERDRAPLRAPGHILSYAAGAAAFVGTLAALHERERSGAGQLVEVSSLETLTSIVPFTRTEYTGQPERRTGGVWSGIRLFETRNGHVSLFPAMLYEQIVNALLVCGVDVSPDDRPPRSDMRAFYGFVAEHVRKVPSEELIEALWRVDEHSTIYDRVYTPRELPDHEQLSARSYFHDWRHPELGKVPFPGPPARLSATPMRTPAPAPAIGAGRPAGPRPRASSSSEAADRPPLEGVRVCDLTQAWLGPYATQLLAALGADVVKVESPHRPDVWRVVGHVPDTPTENPDAHPWNTSPLANSVNCTKRSLTLDLRTEEGRRAVLDLAHTCDVLMENYTSGALARFGLTEEALRESHPGLVIASFSGYGKTGPYAGFRTNGVTIETTAGWTALHGYPGGQPVQMGFYQADAIIGLQLCALTLVALWDRRRHGRAQTIDGSMQETAVGYIGEMALLAALGGDTPPIGNRHPDMAPHGVFRCAGDDEWVAVTVRDDSDWARLTRAVPELADERFATASGRLTNVEGLEERLEAWTRERRPPDVMDILQGAGVPAGVVRRTTDVLECPHLTARGFFAELHHPDMGRHRYAGFPWRLSRSPLRERTRPPRLGEHSAAVLAELGRSEAEIARLRTAGVTAEVLEREPDEDVERVQL